MTGLVMPLMVRLPSSASFVTLVEVKVMTGLFSTSKNSGDLRCVSRSALLVSTDASCTVAWTVDCSKGCVTFTTAAKSLNWPRTLLTMRWRAAKPTSLCAASTFQVPAVRSERLVMVKLLGLGSGFSGK